MSKERETHSQGRGLVNCRALLRIVAVAIIAVAIAGGTLAGQQKAPTHSRGGHLYMQTNEIRNAVVHYRRSPNGTLTEVERLPTGGAGSGVLSPIYHTNRPNDLEGAGSVCLTPDRRFLFVTNAGDNSVSSFSVSEDGKLTLVDTKRTGNETNGGAKSLAYAPSSHMLFVVHSFGPDHLRLMSVDDQGKLTPRPERYSVSTKDWPNRMPTMAVLSPDGKFLILGTTFDELPSRKNPDGSVILWIPHDGKLHVIASNAPDPDGIVIFPVNGDGSLGKASPRIRGFQRAFHGRANTVDRAYVPEGTTGDHHFLMPARWQLHPPVVFVHYGGIV